MASSRTFDLMIAIMLPDHYNVVPHWKSKAREIRKMLRK